MDHPTDTRMPDTQFVSYSLAGEEYAQEISRIHEINKVTGITKVPHTPKFIVGVVNMRGRIIPVVDMRRLLGLPAAEESRDRRIIVMDVRGYTAGLLVDAVHQVVTIGESELLDSPGILQNVDEEFIRAVAKIDDRLVICLDIEKLISAKEVSGVAGPSSAEQPQDDRRSE